MNLLTAVIITALGFNIGQLYVRINYLDGSLDKPWLLLPFFWIPPLSFIPAGYLFFNKIEKGKIGSPYDSSMLYAIISAIIIPIIINKIEYFDNYKGKILKTFLLFIMVYLSLYIKEKKICKDNIDHFKIMRNVSIANIISIIMPLFISFIPIFGTLLTIIRSLFEGIDIIINSILIGLSYMFVILIINMYQGTYLDKYCGDKENKSRVIIFTIISQIISIFFS